MNVASLKQTYGGSRIQWWEDARSVALVKRTAAKDCDADEFDQFVAVCRELGLSPLRKQIYAFVFSKEDPSKRQMALVVGIDGGRSIAARSGNYRPDDRPPEWVFDEAAKNPLTNPHGIVSCTVGVYHRPTRTDPFERITATVFWEEFAPIVKTGDADAYEWVSSGEFYPQGHKKAGQEKMRKQLRPGATANITERLDPKKEQWTRAGRHKISLCAEMQALRRGWPEDMSRLYVEEETDKAATVIDGDYSDLTPTEMVAKAEVDARVERLGGPALFAALGENGALIRVPHGQFADRMLEATANLPPAEVAVIVDRNKEAIKEFWAHNKTDAHGLKKELERRSDVSGVSQLQHDNSVKAPASQQQQSGTASKPTVKNGASDAPRLTGRLAERHRDNLLRDIDNLESSSDLLLWARDADAQISRLPDDMQETVRAAFSSRQSVIKGMER